MLDTIITSSEITLTAFLLCTGISLTLGVLTALLSQFREKSSQSFAIALAMLPAVVQVIIMLVNGNIGTGVAVAGAFGLVRFRSASGSAREISLIFLAMAIGLATGMGYTAAAVLFFVIMAAFLLLLQALRFGAGAENVRTLKITIGESQDYDGLFDDLFRQYTISSELERVKTSNMGTLYELEYRVVLKDEHRLKAFLDELRCRNGNLNIVCGRPVVREAL